MYISVLCRLFLEVLHPPIVQMYPPISVSEAAAPPIRMMACMQSQSVFNSNYQTVTQMQVNSNGMQYNCFEMLHFIMSLYESFLLFFINLLKCFCNFLNLKKFASPYFKILVRTLVHMGWLLTSNATDGTHI